MKKLFVSMLLMMNAVLLAQPGQTEYVPVTEVPASEQLPAAPLVIAAYSFVWLAFLTYAWLMWRRVGKVERELNALSVQLAKKRP